MKPFVVGISEIGFAQSPRLLITYGLGSCVAVVLHCKEAGVGSMAHVMLPVSFGDEDASAPGKFADTAVASMVEHMERYDIRPPKLVAKVAGGADMFSGQFVGMGRRVGARNVLSARKALDHFGIRLVSQDVGGTTGRTVEFSTRSGVVVVRTLRGGVKRL